MHRFLTVQFDELQHVYAYILYNHHSREDIKYFHNPDTFFMLLNSQFSISNLRSDFYHCWLVLLFLEQHVNGSILYIHFGFWLFLLSIMILRFIHIVCALVVLFFQCWVTFRYGLHWWLSGKESTCQCRWHGFDPWVRKIPWRKKW